MELQDFMFPVTQADVFWGEHYGSIHTSQYKAIKRIDTNSLITINPSTYQLITNEELINKTITQLENLGVEYVINESHSFVENHRMKLHLEFPNLRFNDGDSDINMSLFLHNSYNQVEGIRILWGAIKSVCTNGMIWGTVMKKIYLRHRGQVATRLEKIGEELQESYKSFPDVQKRIEILKVLTALPIDMLDQLSKTVGKNIVKKAMDELEKVTPSWRSFSQWELYNKLTYAISHFVAQHLRTQKQLALARVFKL